MYYIIKESRLVQLLEAEQTLRALEAAGVDNWEGMDGVERLDDAEVRDMLSVFPQCREVPA